MSKTYPDSITITGATACDEIEGIGPKSDGLILKIHQDQPKGVGVLKGRFDIVASGTGQYASYLEKFVGQTRWADDLTNELIELISSSTGKRLSRLTIFHGNSLRIRSKTK